MESKIKEYFQNEVKNNVVPALCKFIEIPNQSKAFDKEWETNGLMKKAINFCMDYAKK